MAAGAGLVFAQEIPARVTGSNPLVVPVCGWLAGDGEAVSRIEVEVDGHPAPSLDLDEPLPRGLWPARAAEVPGSARGFAGDLVLPAREPGFTHAVKLTALTRRHDQRLSKVQPVERAALPPVQPATRGLSPRIAICMAVFNPDRRGFAEQVDSIIAQEREDWICIVSDDGSNDDGRAVIDEATAGDPRFFHVRNTRNLGFYGNFEAALARVPPDVEFVALSDQDDRWYPYKLEALANALVDGASLAYSDMRIVDDGGRVISASYWGYRRNSWTSLPLMLVANTVTGAACMMRRSLVDLLLPFPPRVGDAFHDHWIACAALATGRIEYVDRPLYDYVQHGGSIIGHCGFEKPRRASGAARNPLRYLNPVNAKSLAARFTGSALAVYWHECRRIESICRNLLERADIGAGEREALEAYGRGMRSMASLVALNLRTRNSARLTDNAERRLARGYLVHELLRRRRRALH